MSYCKWKHGRESLKAQFKISLFDFILRLILFLSMQREGRGLKHTDAFISKDFNAKKKREKNNPPQASKKQKVATEQSCLGETSTYISL